MFLITCLHTSY